MRGLILPLVLSGVGACAAPSGGDTRSPAPPVRGSAASPDSLLVTLDRGPCFGTCPVYSVTIDGKGNVGFEGRRFVSHQGRATARVPAARVDSLVAELRAGGWYGFAESYLPDAPACGRYATDSPIVETSVTVAGETRRIRHDYGCSAAPAALARLERRIDEVAETARWIGP